MAYWELSVQRWVQLLLAQFAKGLLLFSIPNLDRDMTYRVPKNPQEG
jgi:hypothetical protein